MIEMVVSIMVKPVGRILAATSKMDHVCRLSDPSSVS